MAVVPTGGYTCEKVQRLILPTTYNPFTSYMITSTHTLRTGILARFASTNHLVNLVFPRTDLMFLRLSDTHLSRWLVEGPLSDSGEAVSAHTPQARRSSYSSRFRGIECSENDSRDLRAHCWQDTAAHKDHRCRIGDQSETDQSRCSMQAGEKETAC